MFFLLFFGATVVANVFARITSERENQFSWMPDILRRGLNYLHATVVDVLSLALLALFFPVNLERFDPKRCDPSGGPPILCINGFLGSSNNFIYHRRCLERAGYKNIFTINLGHPFQSLEQYTGRVKKKIDTIRKIIGERELVLIGHSMGGLIATKLALESSIVITIGTPFKGTKVAKLFSKMSRAVKEMCPNSPYLRNLEFPTKTCYYHIANRVDHMVRPSSSAEGPADHEKVVLDATGHIGYLFSSRVSDSIIKKLQQLTGHRLPV